MSQEIYDLFNTDFDEEVFELDFSAVNQRTVSREEVTESQDIQDYDFIDTTLSDGQQVWSEDNCIIADQWLPEFRLQSGPKIQMSDKPIDIFNLFFDEEFYRNIVRYTNDYSSDDENWKPITRDELKTFVGIQIVMGIKRLDEEKDHWSSDDVLKTVVIKRSMSRNRYRHQKEDSLL